MRLNFIALTFVCSFLFVGSSFAQTDKIVGGRKALPGEFPYIVSLQDRAGHFCGGSLIKKNWVLTAAHCVGKDSRLERVIIGMQDLRDTSTSEIKTAKKIIVHPLYNDDTMDWDFALIELNSDSAFPPIDLNTREFAIHKGDAILMTIAGWGLLHETDTDLPNELRTVQLPLISSSVCNKVYKNQITDRMLCAGIDRGGKDSCQGDSGGPMTFNDNGHLVLAGIVSWGDGCARPHAFGIYSKVSAAQEWIQKSISEAP
jgi:trypsin